MTGQVGKIETLTTGEVKVSVYVQREHIPADLMAYAGEMVEVRRAGEEPEDKDKFYQGMKQLLVVIQDMIDGHIGKGGDTLEGPQEGAGPEIGGTPRAERRLKGNRNDDTAGD